MNFNIVDLACEYMCDIIKIHIEHTLCNYLKDSTSTSDLENKTFSFISIFSDGGKQIEVKFTEIVLLILL